MEQTQNHVCSGVANEGKDYAFLLKYLIVFKGGIIKITIKHRIIAQTRAFITLECNVKLEVSVYKLVIVPAQ